MNDFTKEELQQILSDIDATIFKYGKENVSKKYFAMRSKIELMIYNYCEHEKVIPNYDCKTECDKCGKIL